jgi:hypothetical protein
MPRIAPFSANFVQRDNALPPPEFGSLDKNGTPANRVPESISYESHQRGRGIGGVLPCNAAGNRESRWLPSATPNPSGRDDPVDQTGQRAAAGVTLAPAPVFHPE